MKHLIIPVVLILLLLTGCSKVTYKQMSMSDAKTLMESEKDFILVDVRTEEEYLDGHIPGAINIPNETISEEEIPELPKRDQKILVYCQSGNRSRQAADKLVKLGYTNVVEIGGINDWTGELSTEKEDVKMSVVKINKDNFENEVLKSDKPVLVDFYADWCGPCRMVAPVMEEIAEENENIKVVKINIDEQPELAQEYRVMSIPTIAVIKDGQLMNIAVGARPKEDILNMLSE